MLVLRPYQQDAIVQLRTAYAHGKRAPMYQLPTGGGKSLIFGTIANESAKKGTRVLILVHRRELLLQGSKTLRECGVPHGLVMSGLPNSKMQVRIASKDTLIRRLPHTMEPDLIICDEAHHLAGQNSWRRILDFYPRALVLGVTATPRRLDKKGLGVTAGGVFDHLIIGPSVRELTDQGYLVPATVYAPPQVVDLNGIKHSMGDYDKKELSLRVDKPKVTGDAVAHYLRLAPGEKGIVFCVSVDHARHMAEAFSAAGVKAESIDGKMSDSLRDAIMGRFRSGETMMLTSCELVGEGLDVPDASVAVCLRPTESLTVCLQQWGRVLRPAKGKERAIILDHVGAVGTHGLPDAERVWSLEGQRKKPKAPPVRRCIRCFACFSPRPKCPNCGYEFGQEPAPRTIGYAEGDLAPVTGATYDEVRERMRNHQRENAACRTVDELIALGVRRGYSSPEGWARRYYAARERLVSA